MKLFNTKYFLSGAISLLCIQHAFSQAVVEGTVLNNKREPINAATILIKPDSLGTNADSAGHFSFRSIAKGKKTLQISSVGYVTKEIEINATDPLIHLTIILKDESKTLGEVVVSAGSFEASDKAKGASLTPIDAVTVAGNGGDIANAMRFLPGAQQVGEKEGLFVRGGTSEETKQFVDGALLPNPNYASVPGLPQPARLNPFLFKGILFSSGGYSALYGDALSSALILETVDLPDKSSASLHIFPQSIGAGFQNLSKNQNSSSGININYGNLQLYNHIIPQSPDFFHGPEYFETDANFRIKTGKRGMLKFYTNYGYSRVGMRNPDVDSLTLRSSFQTQNENYYANISYRDYLARNWRIDAVAVYNFDKNNVTNQLLDKQNNPLFISSYPYNQKNNAAAMRSDFVQGRAVLTKFFNHRQAFRFGAEYFYTSDHDKYNDTATALLNNHIAAFAEADIYLTENNAAKVGLRSEYSSLLNQLIVAPRISLAHRFNNGGQVNMAYGIFYQQPEITYLAQNKNLGFTRATHYLINYQKKENNRLFRIEAYYKSYKDLVVTEPSVSNDGDGYAKGVELFFRDKKTFKNFDYWITYTYLDTKRKFLNYPYPLRPDFTTPHTVSIAIKRFFQDINLSANMSYSLATGRPYYNIETNAEGKSAIYDQGTTYAYNAMNLSFAYLFSLFKGWKNKDFSGIGFGVNNVFGTKQIFGYNYSYDGVNKIPITTPATRGYYIGIFMTFGIDRRDDFINENLR